MRVFSGDKRIIVNKILFILFLGAITIGILWLSYGKPPESIAIYSPLVLALLYGVWDSFKTYDPKLHDQFTWWFKRIFNAVLLVLTNIFKRDVD